MDEKFAKMFRLPMRHQRAVANRGVRRSSIEGGKLVRARDNSEFRPRDRARSQMRLAIAFLTREAREHVVSRGNFEIVLRKPVLQLVASSAVPGRRSLPSPQALQLVPLPPKPISPPPSAQCTTPQRAAQVDVQS